MEHLPSAAVVGVLGGKLQALLHGRSIAGECHGDGGFESVGVRRAEQRCRCEGPQGGDLRGHHRSTRREVLEEFHREHVLRVGVLLQRQQGDIAVSEPGGQIGVRLHTHDMHIGEGLQVGDARVRIGLPDGTHQHKRPIGTPTGQCREHRQVNLVGINRPDEHQTRRWDVLQRAGRRWRRERCREMRLIRDIAVVIGAGIQSHQRRLEIRRRGEDDIHGAAQLPLAVRDQLNGHPRLGMDAVNTVVDRP